MHGNGQPHHHQTHLQMSFTSVSAAYAPHLQPSHPHHHSNFHHHSAPIHHPQPMPFSPIVHHNHHLAAHPPNRLDHNKMSAFEFPNHTNGSDLYSKVHHAVHNNNNNNSIISSNNNNNNNNINSSGRNSQQNGSVHHLPIVHSHLQPPVAPSPSHTIRSGSSLAPSSEGSPQLIVDNVPNSPLSLCNSSNNSTSEHNRGPMMIGHGPHSGLMDILLRSDKCQVCSSGEILSNLGRSKDYNN